MKKYLFYKTAIEGLMNVGETVRVIEQSAGSHIHFLKKQVWTLTKYKNKISTMLGRLSCFHHHLNHFLLQTRTSGQDALVVLTGDKGVVGGLYHQLVNQTITQANTYDHIWVIGRKGREYLRAENIPFQAFTPLALTDLPTTEQIRAMSTVLFKHFQSGPLKKIDILYPKFLSLAEQRPTTVQFLPFAWQDKNLMADDAFTNGLPLFEPSPQLIFDLLVKKYINVSLAEIVLTAKLSELAARTVTAESAIKETKQLVRSLNRDLLKEKHLAITQKQITSFGVHSANNSQLLHKKA